jgi:hypothetical protein
MIKYLFITIMVITCNLKTEAQNKSAPVFNSYNSAGFIAGKLPAAFTAQTENGIAYKKWFAGAGVAIDLYYKETLPLFVAVKKEISLKTNSLFLYANAGKNIITKDKKVAGIFSTIETKGGFYADAGVGYKVKIAKKSGVFFSIGNTVKNIRQIETTSDFFGMPGLSDTHYKFSRLVFRLGYQF